MRRFPAFDLVGSKKVVPSKLAIDYLPNGGNDDIHLSLTQQDQIITVLEKDPQSRSKASLVQLNSIVEKHPVLGGAKVLGTEVIIPAFYYRNQRRPSSPTSAMQVWTALLHLLTSAAFAPGESIVTDGDFSLLAPFACLIHGDAVEYDSAGDPLGTLAPGRFLLARRGVHSVTARARVVVMRIAMPAYDAFLGAHPEADVVAKAGALRELPYFRHWGLTATRSMAYLFRAAAYGPGETVYSAFQAAAGPSPDARFLRIALLSTL